MSLSFCSLQTITLLAYLLASFKGNNTEISQGFFQYKNCDPNSRSRRNFYGGDLEFTLPEEPSLKIQVHFLSEKLIKN